MFVSVIFPGTGDLDSITSYLLDLDDTAMYNLGIVLGLGKTHLSDLKSSGIPFRDEVISEWLSKADHVSSKGDPTWRTLAHALSHNRVRQIGIAQKIRNERLN